MPSTNEILGLILGGGAGTRLHPLTRQRSKPAVPIAGKYRLIDLPISNCINSNIDHIAVLTQYNSVSLHRHINQTYTFDNFHRGWVEILAAEQSPRSMDWYQGTADAVRKQLFEILATHAKYVIILAGDHLYRMDYSELANFHWEHQADVTVAVQPVPRSEAHRLGLLKVSEDNRITAFVEKPRDPQVLERFTSRDDPERPFVGSMGLYLFNIDVLIEALENSDYQDFGSQVIPETLNRFRVYGYTFDGYWEDIGTIRSFYNINLRLALPDPPFNFYDPVHPIYTHARYLPGSVINGALMNDVLLTEGGQIQKAEITESVVGLRSIIGDGVRMHRTVMMGADYYDEPSSPLPGGIPVGVGKNCEIEGAILDKNVRLGEGVVIRPFPPGTEIDEGHWTVRDGIVVIPKSTVLHAGTVIAPE